MIRLASLINSARLPTPLLRDQLGGLAVAGGEEAGGSTSSHSHAHESKDATVVGVRSM